MSHTKIICDKRRKYYWTSSSFHNCALRSSDYYRLRNYFALCNPTWNN